MKIIIFCACLITFALCKKRTILSSDIDPLSDLMVNKINSLNTTWKAGKNFDGYTINQVAKLCGVKKLERSSDEFGRIEIEIEPHIPKTFDARRAWPNCPSISFIRDQGSCGSCWAFGAAEVMSDRTCIHSNGIVQVILSPEDILSCCIDCGFGCKGGYIESAYEYWVTDGVVSGGLFNGTGCKPYKIAPCEHHVIGPRPNCTDEITPACEVQCQSNYGKTYLEDKHYGLNSYRITSNVTQIQSEILRNGPVTAGLIVYSDFPNYKSGVYQRHSNDSLGGHAVRILGWGIEKGVPYWLVANSWNTDWGDKGYFKIRRGINECGIEDHIVAGIPKN